MRSTPLSRTGCTSNGRAATRPSRRTTTTSRPWRSGAARGLALAVLALCLPGPLSGAPEADAAASTDPESVWRAGFATLSVAEPADGAAVQAALSLPRLLASALAELPEHRYSAEAALARSRRLTLSERVKADAALASALALRDRAHLGALSPEARRKERTKRELELRSARARAEAARTETGIILVPPAKPFALHAANLEGRLLEAGLSAAELATREGLDLVVLGRLRRRGAYLALRLEAWDRDLGAPILAIDDYFADDDLEALAARVLPRLRDALAGAPTRRLLIAAEPAEARLSILDAAGSIRWLEPGERVVYLYGSEDRRLRAEAPGRLPLELDLPGSGSDERIELSLRPAAAERVVVLASEPSGASLYLEGLKVGETPMELAPAPFARLVELRLEGYAPLAFALDPERPQAPLRLLPHSEAEEGAFDRERDAFYDALGAFVVSLPLTVLSFQAYRTYYDAALSANASGDAGSFERLRVASNVGLASVAASASASLGLLGYSGFRLWRYIGAAE